MRGRLGAAPPVQGLPAANLSLHKGGRGEPRDDGHADDVRKYYGAGSAAERAEAESGAAGAGATRVRERSLFHETQGDVVRPILLSLNGTRKINSFKK